MIFVDAAPLIALFDADDHDHELCLSALEELRLPLYSCWPVITEAMYFLQKYTGWRGQQAVWRLIVARELIVLDVDEKAAARMYELMEKYRNLPMDLADATLVALAEKMDCRTVFTLDSDFRIYKFKNRATFKIVPY